MGGRLGVKVFPNAALGQERDAIEQLKIGGLDMMCLNVALLTTSCLRPSSPSFHSSSIPKITCTPSLTGRSVTRP
jgi:hypothetical protein